MFLHFDSLRTKLLLATLSFLAVIAVAFALLVNYGFRQTQQNAKQQSIAGLQAQGRSSLQALVEREGQLTMIYLQQPATASRTAAEYMPAANLHSASDSTAILAQLEKHTDGHIYDPSVNRRSDVFVPNFASIGDPAVQKAVVDSAVLDGLAPVLLDQNPQAVAIYYVSTSDVSRYYPMGTLEGNAPPDTKLTEEPWFSPTGPDLNPSRHSTWSPLYLDGAGNGLMITTCTPVYASAVFDGVVCMDVTLRQLLNHLTELRSNLSASGLDVASIAISTGLASQQQQSNRSFQNARSFGINLRGIKGGETDPYDSERPIVLRLNGSRGWSNAGVDLSI